MGVFVLKPIELMQRECEKNEIIKDILQEFKKAFESYDISASPSLNLTMQLSDKLKTTEIQLLKNVFGVDGWLFDYQFSRKGNDTTECMYTFYITPKEKFYG